MVDQLSTPSTAVLEAVGAQMAAEKRDGDFSSFDYAGYTAQLKACLGKPYIEIRVKGKVQLWTADLPKEPEKARSVLSTLGYTKAAESSDDVGRKTFVNAGFEAAARNVTRIQFYDGSTREVWVRA